MRSSWPRTATVQKLIPVIPQAIVQIDTSDQIKLTILLKKEAFHGHTHTRSHSLKAEDLV